ncbi:hypothetical protein GCM10022252_07360 [Streptosporangium oxazolinicum]|uniref:Immunity protein 35 domain-containing protein n=1 Tax=Streptosporangium oxazolinicum TaxID=909287 RepID=A0ABP8AD84_9ACTN
MNAPPPQGNPMSRRGDSHAFQANAAAQPVTEPTIEQPPEGQAVTRARDLTLVLSEVYGIEADVHELRSGNAIVSLYYGLLAYTDGERFWWTGPELSDSGAPVLSSALTLPAAAEQLAEHYRILRTRPAASILESELPLLADTLTADHVVPR